MKQKKLVALFLAASLALSPASLALADTGSATGSGSTEGYVVEEAFDVTLPTVSATDLNFKLDPQGLLKISDPDNYGSEVPGSIIFPTTKTTSSPVMFAENDSSFPVLLGVEVTLTNDATNPVTIVDDSSTVATGTGNNVYFAVVPEQKYTDVSDYDTSKPSEDVALALDPTTAKQSLYFKVDGTKDNYKIVDANDDPADPDYQYVPIDAPDWDSVGFTITGLCNENADWAAFDTANGALSLNLVWNMDVVPEGSTVTSAGNDAYGLVTYTAPAAPVTPVDPSITTLTYPLTAATAVNVNVDLGAGTSKATGIASVKAGSTTIDPSNYSFDADAKVLTLKSTYVDTLIAAHAASTTSVDITLTYTAPVTTASASYNNGAFWINTSSDGGTTANTTGAFSDVSKLSNLKIKEGSGTAATVASTLSNNWIKITWTQAAAAGATWNSTTFNNYTITFTYNGVNYTATAKAGQTAQ